MPRDRARLGRLGEGLAVAHLTRLGWLVMARNWRCRHGEIDIVALDSGCLVVCEVKTRASRRAGAPLEAVTPEKVARLHLLAGLWLRERGSTSVPVRIDAIGVRVGADGSHTVHHVRGVQS